MAAASFKPASGTAAAGGTKKPPVDEPPIEEPIEEEEPPKPTPKRPSSSSSSSGTGSIKKKVAAATGVDEDMVDAPPLVVPRVQPKKVPRCGKAASECAQLYSYIAIYRALQQYGKR